MLNMLCMQSALINANEKVTHGIQQVRMCPLPGPY